MGVQYSSNAKLEKLLITGEGERLVQKLVREVLKDVRAEISSKAHMAADSDPRGAYRAVKHTVYRRILGGNVSILDKRKAGQMSLYEPQRRSVPGQRGGNRMSRSARTEQLMSYRGADRGFILRFLNSGAGVKRARLAGSKSGTMKPADRGFYSGNNWFSNTAPSVMNNAADKLARMIEYELEKITK